MSLKRHQQNGLSMIEVMVALVISGFLIIGLTQVYLDHKRAYIFQQSQADNLDNSRFAVSVLDEWLAKAGYRRAPDQAHSEVFIRSTALSDHCETFAQNSVITQIKTTADTGQTGFCLRYQPAQDGELTCDGNGVELAASHASSPFSPLHDSEMVYSAIIFQPHKTHANQGSLNCITASGKVELLRGIADLRIEFAAGDIQEKRLNNSAPFKSAQHWAAQDGPVRAVRYAVLAASRPNQRDGDSSIYRQWHAAADATTQKRLAAQDKRQLYQVVTGTQALRNMMP